LKHGGKEEAEGIGTNKKLARIEADQEKIAKVAESEKTKPTTEAPRHGENQEPNDRESKNWAVLRNSVSQW
jgi:hypothetical protein